MLFQLRNLSDGISSPSCFFLATIIKACWTLSVQHPDTCAFTKLKTVLPFHLCSLQWFTGLWFLFWGGGGGIYSPCKHYVPYCYSDISHIPYTPLFSGTLLVYVFPSQLYSPLNANSIILGLCIYATLLAAYTLCRRWFHIPSCTIVSVLLLNTSNFATKLPP